MIWLRTDPRTQPGRIATQLARYERAPLPWSVDQLMTAMNAINQRLNFSSPVATREPAFGLLRWYLEQIDPIADHPHSPGPFG